MKQTALILTALDMEYLAVRSHLADLAEVVHPRGTVYEIGGFQGSQGISWDVAIAEVGAGNPVAGIETTRALDFFRPKVALFVGVAGGLKDVAIGDVVAADYVYGYESSKIAETLLTRMKTFGSSYPLVQRARAIRRSTQWLDRIDPKGTPRAFVGPIAAGEQVIADRDSDTYKMLLSHAGDALAVEMEGWGFLFGAHTNGDVPAMVIRGISDLIEGKNPEEDFDSQPRAARHAAAFAFELLATLDLSHNLEALEAMAVDNLVMPSGDNYPTRTETPKH